MASPPLKDLRLWDDREQALAGAMNMATDEALLAWAAGSGVAALRFYRWERPTLSFGYFMAAVEAGAAQHPGEAMVRRWTGGGVVHHAGAVTWSLAVPATEGFFQVRPAVSYALLHAALARCLAAGGLHDITLVPPATPAPAGGSCAESAAPGDLLWEGRKIAGAGQRRTRHGLLHQGVIFLPEADLPHDFPQQLAAVLAEQSSTWALPSEWHPPVAKYEDPAWNARR